MGSTTELRRALKARFFRHAVDLGFTIDERHQPALTTFRRRAGNGVQIIDVQWDKYGRPRFAIHFGTCPAGGLQANGALYPAAQTLATWCLDTGSLWPRRWGTTRAWFRQDSTWAQRVTGRPALRNASDVVTEVLALFPEVERYWNTGEIGPHLKLWHRHPGP